MSIQIITIYGSIESSENDRINKNLQSTAEDTILKAEINITAPVGYTLYNKTPIIIKLKDLASQMPEGIDTFGNETGDLSDDINWNAVYVTESDSLLPSQVDDIDSLPGYSDNDELVFQLPEDMNIASGETVTFSVFFGTNANDLPTPFFPEVCKVYDYPRQPEIEAEYGVDMVQESYNIENGIIRATVLVEAAWSSGGIYELHLLDEQGNSRFNFIKQKFQFGWEYWKWTRFTCVEQFVEQNQHATTNPFFLLKIISGPVRAQIVLKSVAAYGKAGSPWGQVPGVYGVVTYNMFANLPYFDYSLTTEGPNAASNPELAIELWNRDYGGGSYSPYKYNYIPGKGYLNRIPDGLADIKVTSSEFDEPWMVQKLKEGEQMRPSSVAGSNDDKLGYGMIFDDTYFTNTSWGQTEMVKFVFGSHNFNERPLTARYVPFDYLITDDGIGYMGKMYQEWIRPDPIFDLNVSLVSTTEVSFDYIFVTQPQVIFDNTTDLLNITNIEIFSTTLGEINDTTLGVSNSYKILFNQNKTETLINGSLTWNNETRTWKSINVDLSPLSLTPPYTVDYVVVAYCETENVTGISPPSVPFPEIMKLPDTEPPIIITENIARNPPEIVRSTDIVNITALITDEDGEVALVILSYYNGSWYNVTMGYQIPLFYASIPPQSEGKVITYKIIAYDDSNNWNQSVEFSYTVLTEYKPGQGVIPLVGLLGLGIGVVVIALKTTGMHKQKYDQVE